jgi:hypothetical protein
MGITSLGRRLTTATLAASITVLVLTALRASPAHAVVVPTSEGVDRHTASSSTTAVTSGSAATAGISGGTTGGTSGTNAPAGPYSNAPTENLFRVASHLVLRQKSVSALVSIAPGLGITNPVQISILFGAQRITQDYNVTFGNRFAAEFDPLDGGKRQENITVVMREDAPTGPILYFVPWTVNVEPLFDFTVSRLFFGAIGSCDPLGGADPIIVWVDPNGIVHRDGFDGRFVIINEGFAGTWREVGVSSGLSEPSLKWVEDDGPLQNFILPPPRGHAVLPGVSHHVTKVLDGGDCNGQFDFDVTLSVRHYTL